LPPELVFNGVIGIANELHLKKKKSNAVYLEAKKSWLRWEDVPHSCRREKIYKFVTLSL